MMFESFRVSRLGAWSIVLLLLGIAYALVVLPVTERHRQLDTAAKENIELLRNFEKFAANGKSYELQLASWKSAQSSSGLYVDRASLSHASAYLQERVTNLIRRNGATVRSSEALTAKDERGLTRFGLRVQFNTQTAQLQKILYAMESGAPLLMIENIEIASRSGRTYRQVEAEPLLTVRLDVFGFLRPES